MFLQDEKKKKKLKIKKVKYGRIYVWDPNIIPYEGESALFPLLNCFIDYSAELK